MRERSWLKVILGLILVTAVAAGLWFSTPVRALNVEIGELSTKLLSRPISFTITVNVEDFELLPISSIDLRIYKEQEVPLEHEVICNNLPMDDGGSKTYPSDEAGDITVTATIDNPVWGYNSGYVYFEWGYTPYSGYGYGYGSGPAEIIYSVTWNSLRSWPVGDYTIEAIVNAAEGSSFSETVTVALRRPSGGGGGAGGGGDNKPPRLSNISLCDITKTTADICWSTQEKSTSQVEFWVSEHMLSELDEELILEHRVHLTDLMPGTTYTYKTLSADKSGNLAESEELTFTTQGVAATFAVRMLEITPSEVEIGGRVSVSVVVYNSGDATGTYTVTLRVDNVAVATKEVTVAGGAGEKVTFTVTGDEAKTYSINVGGLTGSFVVEEAEAPAPPAPTPTPTPTPTPPAPPVNWWLIGGIIAGVIAVAMVVWLTVIRQRA